MLLDELRAARRDAYCEGTEWRQSWRDVGGWTPASPPTCHRSAPRTDPLDVYEQVGAEHVIGKVACFAPDEELIYLPPRALFDSDEAYAHTAFHELIHWTKLPLDRDLAYDQEELVAEIGAGLLCEHYGIGFDIANSGAYLNNWTELLGCPDAADDACDAAVPLALEAVDFILGVTVL